MSEPYDIGEGVEVTLTFKDRDGVLRDPTEGSLVILAPSGTKTELATGDLTHASTGVFTYDLVFAEAGTYLVQGACEDDVAAVVKTKEYFVRKARI